MNVESIYREHYDWALRVALSVLGREHPEDAEDIVSEVFCALAKAIQNGKGPKDNVRGYLRTCIQREATSIFARRRREAATGALPEPAVEGHEERVARAADRVRALQAAPPAWAELLWHIDVRGLSAGEAADLLGMTKFAAVSALRRARVALRDLIDEQGEQAA